MTKTQNMAASVKQRLLNISQKTGEDFQLLLTRYAIERLLFRLGRSDHANSFVLKGAVLFAFWTGAMHRPTRDVDFLGFGENSEEQLIAVFRALCAEPVGDDGLVFDPNSVTIEQIRGEDEYGGRRVTFSVRLGPARVPLQVDVGFGDAVTPAAEVIEYPTLLGTEPPSLRAYPKETVVAEKVEAMVKLGLANSRMKDFYDLLVLSRTFSFEGDRLQRAFRATFERRGTKLPSNDPVALTATFSSDDTKQKQWKAFVRRSALEKSTETLAEVVDELSRFILPPLRAAAEGQTGESVWEPRGPWT